MNQVVENNQLIEIRNWKNYSKNGIIQHQQGVTGQRQEARIKYDGGAEKIVQR